MAITRTQIAKQLLAKGGRTGFFKGAQADANKGQAMSPGTGATGGVRGGGRDPSKQFVNPTPLTPTARETLKDQRTEARYQITPSTRPRNRIISGLIGAFVPGGGFLFNKAIDRSAMGFNTPTNIDDDDTNTGGDGDGADQIMMAQRFTPFQQDIVEEAIEELSPIELALKQRDELGGARAFAKEGGIMDLETGRQMYLFGKLVKKAKKIVGKITKSPIGKAALAFGAAKLGGGLFGTTKFGFMKPGSKFLSKVGGLGSLIKQKATDFGLYKAGEGLTGRGMLGLGAALTAAPLLFQKDNSEDEYQEFLRRTGRGPSIDIQGIRNDPYSVLARGFYAEGGKPEPVAKKTMPLLDMGGQEMDLRAEGGFVPIGRMEKADDVPARLSKNEFVFTADAVRNAGDGNVDKGAEVMYNMMKNLEAGGEVSEESQGLKGARKMFQTSQRLEEVL